ncbi:APC family permease [Streptomyces sp. TP-A0356]|uniref:APC family permease n=1 Tax=Streptomyces sp. TP-A0356 TaxID=1359208 RepID=UPI000A813E6B|nr:APC family permease [Streptomyces sp. TP-A0356]
MSGLQKSLGGAVGTFLALSTILGSGMMILPGTSYQDLGRSAWLPWAVAAVSVVPLLYCYAWLGRRHPSASGVAHYSEVAFGRPVGRSAGMLATLALVAGIPATAITGGRYIALFSGLPSLAWLFPVAVLALATLIGCLGTNVSGKVQVALVLGLFALVTCTALVALGTHGVRAPSTAVPPLGKLGSVLTAVYVAFTGWETVAFTFEEHKRPDAIPRIFAASYVIVVALYGLVLLGLFSTVDPDDKALDQAPLLRLAERSLGDLGQPVTLALVVAAIAANVCASVLALSRLVYGMARSGYLPAPLARVRHRDGNPVTSVLAVGAVLTLIALLGSTGVMSFQLLFVLSGGIYFVLYGLGAASYTKLAGPGAPRAVAGLCALTVVAVTVLAGPPMWTCWALFAALWLTTAVLTRRPSRTEPEYEPANR